MPPTWLPKGHRGSSEKDAKSVQAKTEKTGIFHFIDNPYCWGKKNESFFLMYYRKDTDLYQKAGNSLNHALSRIYI